MRVCLHMAPYLWAGQAAGDVPPSLGTNPARGMWHCRPVTMSTGLQECMKRLVPRLPVDQAALAAGSGVHWRKSSSCQRSRRARQASGLYASARRGCACGHLILAVVRAQAPCSACGSTVAHAAFAAAAATSMRASAAAARCCTPRPKERQLHGRAHPSLGVALCCWLPAALRPRQKSRYARLRWACKI